MGNATVELCQRFGLLLLLHCVFLATGNLNQDYWGELTLSSWHFCTLHRFFSFDEEKGKKERRPRSKCFLF